MWRRTHAYAASGGCGSAVSRLRIELVVVSMLSSGAGTRILAPAWAGRSESDKSVVIFQLVELAVTGLATLALTALIGRWVRVVPGVPFGLLHLGYFAQAWSYLVLFHLRSLVPMPSLRYVYLILDLFLIVLVALWLARQRTTGGGSFTPRSQVDASSWVPRRMRSVLRRSQLPSIGVVFAASLLAAGAMWSLRHLYFNVDDVLTLYLPRIDFMLESGKPLSLNTSTYDSLLNSYPYGPQIMPYRLAMVVDSRLALTLDSIAIAIVGLLAVIDLARTFACSEWIVACAGALWVVSPMVLTQMGAGLTDLHFTAAVVACISVAMRRLPSGRRRAWLSPQFVVFSCLVCLAFSYKLLAFFYIPLFAVAVALGVIGHGAARTRSALLALVLSPLTFFPVINSARLNWVRYGHPLGDPGVFALFSEEATVSARLSALAANLRQVVPDLVGGNAVAGGGLLHSTLGSISVWGVGVRVSEGVVGPGFSLTVVSLVSSLFLLLTGLVVGCRFVVRRVRACSEDGRASAPTSGVGEPPVAQLAMLVVAGSAALLALLLVVYQRQIYAIATLRYLLPALVVLSLTGCALGSAVRHRWGQRVMAALLTFLVLAQAAIDVPILLQSKRSPLSTDSALSDPRAALSAASGFMYLGDHVLLLDAFVVCVAVDDEVLVVNVARDKFPHAFYSSQGASYVLGGAKPLESMGDDEVVLGDQLEQQVAVDGRVLFAAGYQWMSVPENRWRC